MLHKFKSNKIKSISWKKGLFLLLVVPLFSFALHKEYYSLTKIDFNQKEKSLQIIMKLFTDDVDLALNKRYNKIVELGTEIESKEANTLLELYLKETFGISVNGINKPIDFLGKEFEKNAMFIYLEIKNIDSIQEIEVRASMLMDTFIEQENIVKINVREQQKSFISTYGNDKALFKFIIDNG